MNRNLTATQSDYAVFLPATSGFYSTFVGKQRYGNYVEPSRIPASFKAGIEGLNYLEPEKGEFYYRWCLYSAGHANLDLTKFDESEDMFRNRDRSTSWVLGDSGGFQIGKGVWEGEWRDPTSAIVQSTMADCIAKGIETVPILDKDGNPTFDKKGNPKTTKIDHVKIYQSRIDAAQKKREQVLAWMDTLMDYGMVLDIPAWVERSPAGKLATGITSYDEAVDATIYNNEYFMKHRNGNCKFLNVLQGETHTQADDWYSKMKDFCDPAIYPDNHFNGWSMGGQNMCDAELVLKRVVALKFDNLLQEGKHDWMHFLGTSKLEWACFLTDIQRAVRKYVNPSFTISYDCASPFLATANGQVYVTTELDDRSKWVYRMVPSVDNKKYAQDARLFKDAVIQDGIFNVFDPSPLIDQVEIKDICIYGHGVPNWTEVNNDKVDHAKLFTEPDYLNDPKYWITLGDANKVNKIGKTSWDSFSYAILMGHNVWSHVNAVQKANEAYDNSVIPRMLVNEIHQFKLVKDVIDEIIACPDQTAAIKIIEYYHLMWRGIPGTRGNTGKNIVNNETTTNTHYVAESIITEKVEKIRKVLLSEFKSTANDLYDFDDDVTLDVDTDDIEFTEEEELNLFNLEDSIKNEKTV
jgi:hypothetical protein